MIVEEAKTSNFGVDVQQNHISVRCFERLRFQTPACRLLLSNQAKLGTGQPIAPVGLLYRQRPSCRLLRL